MTAIKCKKCKQFPKCITCESSQVALTCCWYTTIPFNTQLEAWKEWNRFNKRRYEPIVGKVFGLKRNPAYGQIKITSRSIFGNCKYGYTYVTYDDATTQYISYQKLRKDYNL